MHLAQKLLTNIQCSDSSRSFAKEVRALKVRSTVAAHWKLTTTNWEPSLKLILLQLQEKLPKNSALTTLQSFGIWNKLERWKSSVSGCRMSWLQMKKKKIIVLKCHLLLFYTTQQTIFWLDCDVWRKVDFIWQLAMTSSVVGLRRSSKALPKTILAPKNVMVTVWWSTASLIHYRFLNPGKSITSEKSAQ